MGHICDLEEAFSLARQSWHLSVRTELPIPVCLSPFQSQGTLDIIQRYLSVGCEVCGKYTGVRVQMSQMHRARE